VSVSCVRSCWRNVNMLGSKQYGLFVTELKLPRRRHDGKRKDSHFPFPQTDTQTDTQTHTQTDRHTQMLAQRASFALSR
jgi:hypothetical protein